MPSRTKLMIPGPVDVWDETLDALSQPVLPHYGEIYSTIYAETQEYLAQVIQTQNDIFILTSPGSGAVETCLASLFAYGDKVAVISNGPFANRAIEILHNYKCQVIEVESDWGEAGDVEKMRQTLQGDDEIAGVVVVANETGTGVRNPVRELTQLAHEHDLPICVDAISAIGGYDLPMDDWDIDLICTSSNKALEIPPGLGIVAVGERAWEQIEAKKEDAHRGWYYNLSTWKKYAAARPDRPTSPTTMATSHIVALHASLKRIIEDETLAGHWARYAWARKMLRAGLRNLGFEMLVCDEYASYTVTTFWKREDMENEEELRAYMAEKHGYTMSMAWGPLEGRVSRVGHMGRASSPEYLIPFLLGVEQFVREVKGENVPMGASLVGYEMPD